MATHVQRCRLLSGPVLFLVLLLEGFNVLTSRRALLHDVIVWARREHPGNGTSSSGDESAACSEFRTDYEIALCVHNTTAPARAAGRWVYRPEEQRQYMHMSAEHLQCLDQERQGNCHDEDAWKKSNDTAKRSRPGAISKNAVRNSIGILSGQDPWVWESNISMYQTLPMDNNYSSTVNALLGSNRSIWLVGDSLTRQWAQVMRCEFVHVLNRTVDQANQQVHFIQVHDFVTSIRNSKIRKDLQRPAEQDFVVWNTGHHVGPSKIKGAYRDVYEQNLLIAHNTTTFGTAVPDSHVFFRTTSVRHYLYGEGDWDTESSKAGGGAPDMDAKWSSYGGSRHDQPEQNLLALQLLQNEGRFGVLDTSPMMLARADASFDGSHFCIPGPMMFWSRMLYSRMLQQLRIQEAVPTIRAPGIS